MTSLGRLDITGPITEEGRVLINAQIAAPLFCGFIGPATSVRPKNVRKAIRRSLTAARETVSDSLSLIDRPVFILTPPCLTIGINISNSVHRDTIDVSDRHIQIAMVIVILTHDVTNGKNECF